jgi:adenylosuccinate synthase
MMDVLSQLPEIKICTAYELDGETINRFPSQVGDLRRVKPVYETWPGWEKDVTQVKKRSDLPAGARRYLDRISELVGKPIDVVSVGPDREQTIFD